MTNPWKDRVLAYNRHRKQQDEKASDMDVIVGALLDLPPGQLKKIISREDVIMILKKYGYEE